MTMGLPTATQPRGVALNGSVVYVSPDGPDGPVDTVAQPTLEGGVRTFQVIKNATAPHEYTSAMKLPTGAPLTPSDGGTVLVSSGTDENTVVHGLIDAPWARDANGEAVPTSYRVEGDRLVQTVDLDAATAFPVVVDPKLTLGLGIYFNATSAEWKAYGMAATTAGWGGWPRQARGDRQDGLRRRGAQRLEEPRQLAQEDQELEPGRGRLLPDQALGVGQTDQGQQEELPMTTAAEEVPS